MIDSINYEGGGGHAIAFAPSKLRYNKFGGPILSSYEIEEISRELLLNHCPHVLRKPCAIPVAEIIKKLYERTGMLFAKEDLGYIGTAKVLGKVSFHKKTLFLDHCLFGEREAAFQFTVAHEIGHWILHRYNYKNWKFNTRHSAMGGLWDDDNTMSMLEDRAQIGWLEYQANVFAASLITPREMFIAAVRQIQIQIGITKNIGRIYLSEHAYSRRDYEAIINQLSLIFRVSKKSAYIRTKTLKLTEGDDLVRNESDTRNPFTVFRSTLN
ncbi:MAG TPA: ImmA/IrrE family metallo-endopeptidase [Verrucomicrobiae bacterium]|nr:ImmA/IrrE family metallo-endopeptidase [Verrucomicrobiae bacterium]